MICIKCNETGVLNSVLGKEFYYCRNCKEEITLELIKFDTVDWMGKNHPLDCHCQQCDDQFMELFDFAVTASQEEEGSI
jgi:hypothetical protein